MLKRNTDTVRWAEIETECGNYRAGFVAIFRKYEGQPTDERDGNNRIVKVTMSSFARHMGIAETTFKMWVKRSGADPIDPRTHEDRARRSIKHMTTAEKTALANELIADPVVAQNLAPETVVDIVEQSEPVRRETVKRATKRNKEHKARVKDKAKDLQDIADKARDAYDEADTGYSDPTPQTIVRLIRDVHEAEVVWALAGGNSDADTVSALSELQTAVDSWRQRMLGTGPVEITDDDRAWADELGIDLAS